MNLRLCSFALLTLVMAVPGHGLAQKNKANNNNKSQATQASAQEYAALEQAREVVGRLTSVESSTKALGLGIDYAVPGKTNNNMRPAYNRNYRPNYGRSGYRSGYHSGSNGANLQRQMQNIMREQQQIMMTRNPVQRAQKMMQIEMQMQQLEAQMMRTEVQQMANAQRMQMQMMMAQSRTMANVARNMGNMTMNKATKQFDLQAKDEVVVRRANPPVEYDDKGNIKQFSKDELSALRGKDSSVPGYAARYEDLEAGQIVKVYMAGKPKKEKEAVAADVGAGEDRPLVRMIVILADSNQRDPVPPANQKKKKN